MLVSVDPGLLLVCKDPQWAHAVHAAAGPLPIEPCDARAALFRVAGTTPAYSHLLLESGCDDGLFETLLELTSHVAASDIRTLLLGSARIPTPRVTVIPTADRRSVQEALMVGPPAHPADGNRLPLQELKDALAASMISARYQPIVLFRDRRLSALEVLARLDHPDRGTILPDLFVPQIEDAGLAARLTELMAARAFADLTGPELGGLRALITLNVPLDVLLLDEAMDRLESQRVAAGLSADRIVLELTESMPVHDIPALTRVLDRLRGMGYRVAIDDVEPDVPALDALLDLPFTSLKFDKALVARAAAEPEVLRFIQDATDRVHRRGLFVIAEGIESVEVWRQMSSVGVDGAQGFLVARPLPLQAVPVWLEGWLKAPAFT